MSEQRCSNLILCLEFDLLTKELLTGIPQELLQASFFVVSDQISVMNRQDALVLLDNPDD
jgi:hypothetical protein